MPAEAALIEGLLELLVGSSGEADRDDGPRSQIVLNSNGPVRGFEILPHDGESRSYSANVVSHRLNCGGESGHLGFLLRGDARTMVGETDGVTLIADCDEHFLKLSVNEVLRHLADDRIRDRPPSLAGVLVNSAGERLDVSCRVSRLHFDDPRAAEQVVVDGDVSHRIDERIVEGGVGALRRGLCFHGVQSRSVVSVSYSMFFGRNSPPLYRVSRQCTQLISCFHGQW